MINSNSQISRDYVVTESQKFRPSTLALASVLLVDRDQKLPSLCSELINHHLNRPNSYSCHEQVTTAVVFYSRITGPLSGGQTNEMTTMVPLLSESGSEDSFSTAYQSSPSDEDS